MRPHRTQATPRPLDADALRALAIRYVGRYATTRARLAAYLTRKVRERGWADDGEPPVAALAEECVARGYIDDRAWAEARGRALAARGLGARRVAQALAAAGIDRAIAETLRPDAAAAFDAAESFARRRRIGPFALEPADDTRRRRDFAAMARAGHGFEIARLFAERAPGDFPIRDDRG